MNQLGNWSSAIPGNGIGHDVGRGDADGWSATWNVDQPGYLSYGPYWTAPSNLGQMRAEWDLLVDSINPAAANDKVARLEVTTDYGQTVVAQREIYRKDFLATFVYQTFELPFTPQVQGKTYEFRMYWYSPSYMREREVRIRGENQDSSQSLAILPSSNNYNIYSQIVSSLNQYPAYSTLNLSLNTSQYAVVPGTNGTSVFIADMSNRYKLMIHSINGNIDQFFGSYDNGQSLIFTNYITGKSIDIGSMSSYLDANGNLSSVGLASIKSKTWQIFYDTSIVSQAMIDSMSSQGIRTLGSVYGSSACYNNQCQNEWNAYAGSSSSIVAGLFGISGAAKSISNLMVGILTGAGGLDTVSYNHDMYKNCVQAHCPAYFLYSTQAPYPLNIPVNQYDNSFFTISSASNSGQPLIVYFKGFTGAASPNPVYSPGSEPIILTPTQSMTIKFYMVCGNQLGRVNGSVIFTTSDPRIPTINIPVSANCTTQPVSVKLAGDSGATIGFGIDDILHIKINGSEIRSVSGTNKYSNPVVNFSAYHGDVITFALENTLAPACGLDPIYIFINGQNTQVTPRFEQSKCSGNGIVYTTSYTIP